jgi:hypothetical protein
MNVRIFRRLGAGACVLAALASMKLIAADEAAPPSAMYDAAGKLVFPSDYRSWPNIGTGLNMSYGPLRTEARAQPPFTNVFVSPDSYRKFLQSGRWPDRTTFVLEIRGSIAVNNSKTGNNGHYQGEILGIEAEVKDTQRFEQGWGFFSIDAEQRLGTQIPTNASCYTCHATHAAVENTFVQFYPVLRDVAKRHGTFETVPEVF